ncbi:hypothetical protein [Paraburkholderia caribensis]|uniref:hypothetical protein n=1 Tax=Paraburkholderia caribensis TaxID=75105 RepID=UPI0011DFBD1B|nr:hypothetical protein [Paraburkholderia caribensis]
MDSISWLSHGMPSFLFWNKRSADGDLRATDPLGFDALREAMSNGLVPLLTGATGDADEYLWTMIGLRWAKAVTQSAVDADLFEQGFARFERALKQFWYKTGASGQRRIAGIQVVKVLCAGTQPNVTRPILANQRATGLLGNYIVSLRELGLVKRGSLQPVEAEVDRLLIDVEFPNGHAWYKKWETLDETCNSVKLQKARKALGERLFGYSDDRMHYAARAVLGRPDAESWSQIELAQLDVEQRTLARATDIVTQLELAALQIFADALHGARTVSASDAARLRQLASATLKAKPFPASWQRGNSLAAALQRGISGLAEGGRPLETVHRLHLAVTRDVRGGTPWLHMIGDRPHLFAGWKPGNQARDFRFANLKSLIKQTGWKAHAR